ncbi:hypothetical protein P171DRAFT_525574 [Karstenula rhodostoma CBS 690.94]|uniref:Uncharacterized protein n=1 Tax=Karstenula rhodostoma CBS 690.94 TaxID=1392251 RepID=A0A9P4P7Z8_9PLEO|nr:hypothetical protein P171DRAFT_525574 [Karstenula rhodostoma CBS 690.94]
MFLTKNGELLEIDISAKFTHYPFTGVTGRLYPVVGTSVPGVKVRVNFGNDLVSTPFVWTPGNEADSGIAFVNGKEEALARKPLLRRRTTNVVNDLKTANGASEGEDASAGAEAPTAVDVQPASIKAVA